MDTNAAHMAPMNLSDFTVNPDFTAVLYFGAALVTGAFILMVLFINGVAYDIPKGRWDWTVTAATVVAAAAVVIGLIGGAGTGLSAMSAANKATDGRFHTALQDTYGATTDASLFTVRTPGSEPVPVHTSRGNELVTFRQAGGNLVAFRPDGTELPRG